MLNIFLIVLALIWLIFAVVSDLKTREIPNWLNFSLVLFALGARFFYSVFGDNWDFVIQGFFGLAVFFVFANLLYYGRFFAGGDAKLMIALGPILPLGIGFFENVGLFLNYILLFLVAGALFGLAAVISFSFRDFQGIKKIFIVKIKERSNRKFVYSFMIMGLIFMLLGFFEELFFAGGILIFLLPYIYFYTRAIDNHSLVRKISSKELAEGDWLYKNIKIGNKIIKANWDGLTKKEIGQIKKRHRFVMIRRGIEFSLVFLISFLVFVYFYLNGIDLWNSLW